ncbi:hypothetical protein N2152v2_009374 [Parachlorella kessleri]
MSKYLTLLLVALCAVSGVTGSEGRSEVGGPATNWTSLAERNYQEAMTIRDKPDPSPRELQRATKLLRSAAGIEHLGVRKDSLAAAAGSTSAVADAPTGTGLNGSEAGTTPAGDRLCSGGVCPLTASQVELVLRNESAVHVRALKELYYIYRVGDGATMNHAVAHRLLQELAGLGDGDSQTDLGFTLALGVEPADLGSVLVPRVELVGPNGRDQVFQFVAPDLPAALVHYYFGAQAGDTVAQLVLGYRHLEGLGVPKSCQAAVLYYAPVAERVLEMAREREGLPQVRQLRLSHKTAHARQRSTEQEVLHYQWFADFGNIDAARAVAHMLTHGSLRDYEQAIYYLKKGAWPSNGQLQSAWEEEEAQQAAAAGDADAMAHLGHIYANGIAVRQSNDTALVWFIKAAEKGHPSGLFGLGYMHLQGHGVQRNHARALKYFKQAVESHSGMWSGHGDAFFYLGLMHLNGWATKQDIPRAAQLFELAAKAGNLLAAYNLAVLHLRGATSDATPCESAAAQLKRVAERGFPILQEALEDFRRGEYEWALLGYLKAAEMGMELGQSNAAWMLAEGYGYEGPGAGPVALMMWRRAAGQGNQDALLALGDGYWYGKGVARDWARAAQMYNEAGKHHIGQALFNLGYMHEYGAGLPQDFHLAKRFYDKALEAQPEGRLAVQLALLGLRLHSWWEAVEPRLPRSWAWAWAGLFRVSPEGPYHQHHGPKRTLWDRVREALTLDAVFDRLDTALDFEEGMDVTMIGALAALLLVVMWRRQTLRNRQARFFPEAPAAAAAAPTPVPPPQQRQPARQQQQQPQAVPAAAGPSQGPAPGQLGRQGAAGFAAHGRQGEEQGASGSASGSGSSSSSAPTGVQEEQRRRQQQERGD